MPLQAPSAKERRRSTTSTILGFGRAKSPGSLQVPRSEIYPYPSPSPYPHPYPNKVLRSEILTLTYTLPLPLLLP